MANFLRAVTLLALLTAALPRTGMAGGVRIYAAGSLSGAFSAVVKAFAAPAGAIETPVFGPAGLLRQKIEAGQAADILASADMAQPRRLAHPGQPVLLFARNRLCALARQDLHLAPQNMLDRMLDPAVRVATSTPGADPGGDYAWAVFRRAEAVHPGAEAALQGKALKLVGGPDTPPLVPGHGAVEGVFLANKADIMLGYCSGSAAIQQQVPGLVSVALPPTLAVEADYGMVVLTDHPLADRFALFVMSEAGQAILQSYGFEPVALPDR